MQQRGQKQQRIDDEPDGPMAKLQRVLNVRNTSSTALRQILGQATDSTPSNRMLTDVGQARFSSLMHTIKLPLADGREENWELCHPNHLLSRLVGESPMLQEWFALALAAHPNSKETPWKLIVGFDEHIPGNQLASQPSRKSMNLSYSFEELGPALSCDVAWFTPVVARASLLARVVGGWGRMLRDYLKLQLQSESGLETAGVALNVKGRPVVIYAKLTQLLSDGDGLRLGLSWMGPSCFKPCWRHYNVLKKGSDLATHSSGDYVEISESDVTKFRTWTDDAFHQAMDVIVEARNACRNGDMTKAAFESIERAYGFHAMDGVLIADIDLRASFSVQKVARYDWVHVFLAHGILTSAAWTLIEACEARGIMRQGDISLFLKEAWIVPQHRRRGGRPLWRIFNAYGERANREASTIKCGASELISLYGLLRHFVETRLAHDDPNISEELRCFLHLCKVVDLIMLTKRGWLDPITGGRRARQLLVAHMDLDTRLHGTSKVVPKSHWAFDVCDQIAQGGFMFDSFVIERLHLRVKRVAENVKNLHSYERSVLSGVLNDQARRASVEAIGYGLVGPTAQLPGVRGALVADHLEMAGFRVACGDHVCHGDSVGLVLACCTEGDELFVVVNSLRKLADLSNHSATWARGSSERRVWRARDLTECLAWQTNSRGETIVICM